MAAIAQRAPGEVSRLGEEVYQREIQPKVEPGNKGRVIVIDVETGDYAFETADPIEASRLLRERNPNAILYAKRIGFPAVTKMGGNWNRPEA